MTALNTVTGRLAERTGYTGRGGSWRCPSHDDHRPSLSVSNGNGRVLLHCHAGCELDQILAALGLEPRDLFDTPATNGGDITATYDYTDKTGKLLFQVVRKPGKQFFQRRPDGDGGWIWNTHGVRRVPYRLPELIDGIRGGGTIFVPEGERDVDRLRADGCRATCNPGGAGKWQPEYNDIFQGADVVIVADKDQPGYAHARDIAQQLDGIAARVRVVQAAVGQDVSDHLTVEALEAVDLDEPETQPPRSSRIITGGAIFDLPAGVPAIWGRGDEVLWPEGEPFLIVAPSGVGKTTLMGQVVGGLTGCSDSVLGWPVRPVDRVLYIAADRPKQIMRSLRRQFTPDQRAQLDERLVIWRGPPPADLAKHRLSAMKRGGVSADC